MPVSLEVWGNYACFTRPEFKVERVSYDVMTPSAARGLLEAIYWHPGMEWIIDAIHVCAPIRYASVRRNEVEATIVNSTVYRAVEQGIDGLYINRAEKIQQRASLLLRDVRYVIDAHFEMVPEKASADDNAGKFQDIIRRRIRKGQSYHQPYFGCREFPANFKPCNALPPCPDELLGERDLGYMLWDMDYSNPKDIKPMFFRAKLVDGMLRVPTRNSGEVLA